MRPSKDFFAGVTLMCVISIAVVLGFIAPSVERHFDMLQCATGQDMSLRDTTGNISYRVTFKDGKAVKFECFKPTTK